MKDYIPGLDDPTENHTSLLSVRSWHPVQLLIVWVGVFLLAWGMDVLAAAGWRPGLFFRFIAVLLLLVVSWRWVEHWKNDRLRWRQRSAKEKRYGSRSNRRRH
jgi:membrane protein implicated in regulation of membrane protease activity